jgi:hypothetical protein
MRKGFFNFGTGLASLPWFAAMFGPPEITIEEIVSLLLISLSGLVLMFLSEIRIKIRK